MNRNSFLRNSLLIPGLVISAIILSAQVNKNDKHKAGTQKTAYSAPEPVSSSDNAEGLMELDNIARRYETKNLYLSGEILFYPNKDSSAIPLERAQFTSINTPLGSSYEIDSVQTIVNPTITLVVDKREKSIAMMEQDAASEQPGFQKVISNGLSEFREYISSIEVVIQGKEKKLVIKFKEDSPANTSNYEIVYEPESYRIKKVRMEISGGEITDNNEGQNPDDELVLDDENNNEISTGYYAKVKTSVYEVIYKTEKNADTNLVDINYFIKKGVNGYIPVGAFKNYELQN